MPQTFQRGTGRHAPGWWNASPNRYPPAPSIYDDPGEDVEDPGPAGATPAPGAPGADPRSLSRWQRREARLSDLAASGTANRRQLHRLQQFKAGRELLDLLPEEDPRRLGNPRQFYKRFKGAGVGSTSPPFRRMQNADLAKQALGYNEPREQITASLLDSLERGDSDVDLHRGRAPMVASLQEYAQSHLGKGLTPEQEAAIRGRMKDSTEMAAREREMGESSRLAAAGIDPRSGIAASRAGMVANERARGLADIEREITLQDLARVGATEGLATSAAGLGERSREFDVGAEQDRRRGTESLLALLAQQRGNEFGDLLDYAEGGRQARASRRQAKETAKQIEDDADAIRFTFSANTGNAA